MQQRDFAEKTVLITGAGGGVGQALAALFNDRGAALILCDQSADALAGFDAKARPVFNLADRSKAAQAAAKIIAAYGVPDVLVNNAGWTRAETMDALDAGKIGAEIDVNLTGVMAFTDVILKAMISRGGGSIVFISSVNALLHFGNPAYAAAKAGINAYARAIAVENGRHGVRANSVCPGSIRTPAWDHRLQRDPAIPGKLARLYPLGRIVETAEVAEAVAFLASSRASGITGIAMPVDAGLTAGNRPFIDEILG